MTPRERHLDEIGKIREAIKKTKSPYVKRDLKKALNRKLKELFEYDRWRNEESYMAKEN